MKKPVILVLFTLLFFVVAANAGNNITQTAGTSPCQGAICYAGPGNSTGFTVPPVRCSTAVIST